MLQMLKLTLMLLQMLKLMLMLLQMLMLLLLLLLLLLVLMTMMMAVAWDAKCPFAKNIGDGLVMAKNARTVRIWL